MYENSSVSFENRNREEFHETNGRSRPDIPLEVAEKFGEFVDVVGHLYDIKDLLGYLKGLSSIATNEGKQKGERILDLECGLRIPFKVDKSFKPFSVSIGEVSYKKRHS